MSEETTPLRQSTEGDLTISESEFELKFKPFIQLKIIICKNETCGNNFSLTDYEILQLIRKRSSNFELLMHGTVLATCPLCQTTQELNCIDMIGDYPEPMTMINFV